MMEANAYCVNCGRILTTRATWSCAVGNAGARLLGRLHDEEQVMSDVPTKEKTGSVLAM
jgi:predicted Fe-S protein YdhL (DUF1289 family)